MGLNRREIVLHLGEVDVSRDPQIDAKHCFFPAQLEPAGCAGKSNER
jgi:hypothetical protein